MDNTMNSFEYATQKTKSRYADFEKSNLPRPTLSEIEKNSGVSTTTFEMFPSTESILNSIGLSLGAVITPFIGTLEQNEIPSVSFEENDILRCGRCNSYVNMYYKFINSGKNFICNLCETMGIVPDYYFYETDANNTRKDLQKRSELLTRTVDFTCDRNFKGSFTKDLYILYLIENTIFTQDKEIMSQALQSIIKIAEDVSLDLKVQFGIVTFDENIYLYNMKKNDTIEINVVCDRKDCFSPLPAEKIFYRLASEYNRLDFIDKVEAIFNFCSSYRNGSSDFTFAVNVAEMCMENFGGKINAFTSTAGSSDMSFYRNKANSLASKNVMFNIFSRNDAEAEKLEELCSSTNGTLNLYSFDGNYLPLLENDILKEFYQTVAHHCIAVIRTSTGIKVRDYFGVPMMPKLHEMVFPVFNRNTSVSVIFKHESELVDFAYFQFAMIYTCLDGKRNVRVHTVQIPSSNSYTEIYNNVNIGAFVNLLIKQALKDNKTNNRSTLSQFYKSSIINSLKMLSITFDKKCKELGKLQPIPLSRKSIFLPLYSLAIIKSPIFGPQYLNYFSEKNFILKSSCHESLYFIYPFVMTIKSDHTQKCYIVQQVNLSVKNFSTDHSYIFYNGKKIVLFVCKHDLPEKEHLMVNALDYIRKKRPFSSLEHAYLEVKDFYDLNVFREIFIEDQSKDKGYTLFSYSQLVKHLFDKLNK